MVSLVSIFNSPHKPRHLYQLQVARELKTGAAQYTNTSSSSTTTPITTSSAAVPLSSSTSSSPLYAYSSSDEILSTYTWTSVISVGSFVSSQIETLVAYREAEQKSENGTWGPTITLSFASQVRDAAFSASQAAGSSSQALASSQEIILSDSCISLASAHNASNSTAGPYNPPLSCCTALSPCSIYADQVEIIYFNNVTANDTANATNALATTIVSKGYTL